MSKKLFFTPGPSQLYFTVSQHIKEAFDLDIGSISHRSKSFQNIVKETKDSIRVLLGLPDGFEIYFTGSATEIWERIVQNLVRHSSHHFVNGEFARKFYEVTHNYGKKSTIEEVDDGSEFVSFNVPFDSELIAITLNETSTGYSFDQQNLGDLRKNYPNKLIAVDIVSAIPGIHIDFSFIDTAFFSVQKGFGLPAGLGVWIVNERCLNKAKEMEKEGFLTGSYHSLSMLKKHGVNNQTPETPNVLAIFLLLKVIQDMLQKGIHQIRKETIYKSSLIYHTFESVDFLKPFIGSKLNRSKTVCVAEVDGGNQRIKEYFAEKHIIIGDGYGEYKNSHIRIANFPTHSKEQIEMLADQLSIFNK